MAGLTPVAVVTWWLGWTHTTRATVLGHVTLPCGLSAPSRPDPASSQHVVSASMKQKLPVQVTKVQGGTAAALVAGPLLNAGEPKPWLRPCAGLADTCPGVGFGSGCSTASRIFLRGRPTQSRRPLGDKERGHWLVTLCHGHLLHTWRKGRGRLLTGFRAQLLEGSERKGGGRSQHLWFLLHTRTCGLFSST